MDAADYTIWKNAFGTTNAAADGNGNGIVDAGDYTVWRDQLGQSAGSGSASPVPEPSSILLLIAAVLIRSCRPQPSAVRPRP